MGTSEPRLPGVQRSRGIERSLHFSDRREAEPQLLVHEVRELRANAVDVLHGAAQGVDPMNHVVEAAATAIREAVRSSPTGRTTSRDTSSGCVHTPNPIGFTP